MVIIVLARPTGQHDIHVMISSVLCLMTFAFSYF